MLRFELSDGCRLRLLEESDADELFALIDAARAHLSRWLPWAAGQDLEGTLEFIRRTRGQLADNTGFTVAIVCDGAVAGVVGLEPLDWTHRSTSIGYWLGERYQGRGIMTRAVGALVEHAVSAWKLNRIEIRAAVDNVRSRAVPQRLGFREEGTLREAERVGDAYLDIVGYSLLGPEWRSRGGVAEVLDTWGPERYNQAVDPTTTLDRGDLAARTATLSLEQKVRLLTGADFWSLHPEPAAGLRRLVVSDGPAGVRGERWDERDTSANVPSPTALAASWDEALVEELGRLLASESRRKGVDVLLAPTVNLHRTPYGGRHFECFSEDPLLTARIGVAYVRGLQGAGVAATVKHFVANDSETQRMTLDARVGERALRELYLAPFEAIVREAGVWSVMAAYNGVNGQPMTESPLLRDILHREWGFDGVVMSDWFATRTTAPSANAALDLVMPGPAGPWGDALIAAVRAGEVDEATIDDKVVRILRLASRVGALEGSPADTAPEFAGADVAATLRRAAASGFVLARNEGSALPLDRSALAQLAVLGPNALVARTLGGGSATVFPPYTVSPLGGLRAALGESVEIEHGIGVTPSSRVPVAGPPWVHRPDGGGAGVEVRFVAGDGSVLATEHRPGCAFSWLGSSAFPHGDVARVEVHAVVRATDAGTYEIAGSGVGRFRLSVGGEDVFDGDLELPPGADIVEGVMIPPQAIHGVALEAGESVDVMLAHEVGSMATDVGDVGVTFQLNLQPPHGSDDEEIERAVSIARAADVALVVVGTTEEVESEGFDRADLALPGRQDELVRRVAAANRKTVVVVNAGAPVLLPWADEVSAILLAWFPGQEFGNALADVLLGLVEPGGRLPTSWPSSEDGLPSTQPVDGRLTYDEGLSIGYRGYDRDGRTPLYPFGHGLGYTDWELVSIEVPDGDVSASDVPVVVRLRNTGARRGRTVVQLYASRAEGDIERPVRWLAGFATVDAEPGDEFVATVTVSHRAFEHWDREAGGWAVEPGAFRLAAGLSSARQPVSTEITIAPENHLSRR